jgi:hypothetical protein
VTGNLQSWRQRLYGRRGRRVFAAGLFLAVVAFLGWGVLREWDTLRTYPWQLSFGYLMLASGFHSLALGVTFVVWHLMLRRLGHVDDARTNAYIYYLSTLAKRIPSAIWYVGGRLVMYQRVGVARSATLNAVALETVLIGCAGALVYVALLPFYPWTSAWITWLLLALGISLLLIFFIRPRWMLEATNLALRRCGRDPIQVVVRRRDLMLWLGIYLLPWPLAGVSLFFMIQSMTPGMATNLAVIVGVSTLSMLVALISLILPAGLGLKEFTIAALMSAWMPLSVGVVVAISYRVLQTFDEVLWAALAYRLFGRRAFGDS